ncbi:MAG: DUF2304 family protein [Patescibacteria group bacterium]
MIIKILIIIFILFVISRLILRFKDGMVSNKELIFWSGVWIMVIIVTLLPWTADFLAKFIGVARGVDAALYVAIIIILYGIFRISVRLEHIEYEITKIVRQEALQKKDSKEKKINNT